MALTPRFTRQVQRDVAPANPLAGAAATELRNELENFSARRNAELDRRAEEEGFLEGQQAGPGGEFEGREDTIRGRAFQRGVVVAHQAALQTDIRDSIAGYALEHPNDPDGFDAKVEALREGLNQETPGELRPFVEQRINDYAGRTKTSIIAQQQAELEAEAIDDLNKGVAGMMQDAETAAFEGDVLLVEARRQEFGALLEESIGAGFMDEADAAASMQQFETTVTANEVIGNFDRLVRSEGPEAGAEAIKRWQGVKPSSVGMDPEQHEAVTRRLVALRNRQSALESDERAKAAAAEKAARQARTDRVKDSIKVLESGFSLDPDDAARVTEDLDALADPELAGDFDVAQAIQSQVHAFRRAPAAARSEALIELEQSLRAEGANADQVALLKALRKTHNEVSAEVEQDPRGFVNREGLVDDIPLNFESGESLVESLAIRTEAGSDVGEGLIGEPLPLLTAAEATQLAQVYGQAEIEERIGILGAVTAGAGDEAMATLGQLDAAGNRRMALLGNYVLTGQQDLARSVMRGDMLLASDSGIKPKRIDYQATLDDEIGAAMADWPAERQQYIEAAFARYADLKARSGDVTDQYDDGLFEQALNDVLPTARFNGRRVALPAGVNEDRFEEWTEGWTADSFEGVPGGTGEEILRAVQSRGRLVELGGNEYGVTLDSALTGDARLLVDVNREPIVLRFPLEPQ